MTILSRIDLVVLEAYCKVYNEWRREDPQQRRWLWLHRQDDDVGDPARI